MTALQTTNFPQVWQHVFSELRASVRRAVGRGLEALKTPEPLTGDQWANKFFYLSAESSQGEKRWDSYPFQKALLCMMGDDDIQEVDLRKSARVGYTKMLLAMVLYNAHHKRRNQCLWQPTDNDSDEFCKAELEPAIRDVKVMADVFPQFMAKSKANTLNMKKFLGSLLYLKGGTSAGNYRRMTLQCALLDEFDQFDQKIEKSADPFTLAWKRLEGATYPKIICGTTPRVKGLSHIEKRELAADVRMRFVVECPHCQVEHPLMWGGKDVKHGIKWDFHDPEGTAHHVCPHCHGKMTQDQYLRIADTGVWVSDCGGWRAHHLPDYHWTDGQGNKLLKPPRHVAVHVWTAYSPQTTWGEIVRQFLQCVRSAKGGDKAPLEGFVNETLGETWEEEVEKADTHALMARAEDYPLRVVPMGGLDLVAGVDTQDKWWAICIWAIGKGEEMWCVDYTEIDGNPADEREWKKVSDYLQAPLQHIGGAPMKVSAAAIDTGGHHAHQVYNFARENTGRRWYAIKGDSQDGKPIRGRASAQDVNWRGRIIKNGVKLWMVGTDTAKDLFFGRLKVTQPGPGYVHFSKALPQAFYKGLTSEVRKQMRTSTGLKYRWVKVETRNEPLDCFDDQTEVLTRRGWLPFCQVQPTDTMATVNLQTDAIEYQQPLALIDKPYSGDLMTVTGRTLDFAVTPNHRMVTYKKQFDRQAKKWRFDVEPQITLAKDLTIHHTIKISAQWSPEASRATTTIPASHKATGECIHPATEVDTQALAQLLGWYVAEGCSRENHHGTSVRRIVQIAQTKLHGRQAIEAALNRLPWAWHYDGKAYVLSNKQAWDYVQAQCPGGQQTRRVPQWIKDADTQTIEAFVGAAVLGDGWTQNGCRSYATISKDLADDMAELFFKLGGSPSVTVRPAQPYNIKGRTGANTQDQYHVRENNKVRSRSLDGAGRKIMVKRTPYEGRVYCATVPNGTLVVRRNGKMMIAGNCTVYALFSSQARDHYKMTDAQWNKLDNDLRPDLFGLPFAPLVAAPPSPTTETLPAAGLTDAARIEVRDPVTAPPTQTTKQPDPPEHSPRPAPKPAAKPKPKSAFASSEWMSRM